MAETTDLESQQVCKGLEGSNPSPSATSRTTAIGKAGELLVALDLLSKGYEVFLNFTEGSETDMVIATNVGLKRLQVKTWSTSVDGRTGFSVLKHTVHRSGNSKPKTHNYLTSGVIDVFAIAVLDRRCVVYVSANELRNSGNKTTMTFRFEPTKTPQPHVRMASEYTIERALDIVTTARM